jgi:antitoxin (DNA-binding transcriptional repressor) of toxin-antitoxin stability system
MQIVSAREFRTNQTAVLRRALEGESILLTSRLGAFKITPVSEEDSLTSRICEGLREVKLIKSGKLKGYTVEELLDGL